MAGRVLLGEGREAEVFLQEDGTVLKLMRETGYADRVEREASACVALGRCGDLAPEIVDTVVVDGRPGLVMGRVSGTSMLQELERRPLTFLSIADALAGAHAAIHEVEAPQDLPTVHDQLAERLDRASPLPREGREVALRVLSSLPTGDRLCHGDFHLGNVIASPNGPVTIDWGYASRGDPVGDIAQSLLLHRSGAMPPGTSRFFVALAAVGRQLLTRRYLSSYQRVRHFEPDALSRWTFVHAAARLGEPVPDEHATLLRLLERTKGSFT